MHRQAQSILENLVKTYLLSHFAPILFNCLFSGGMRLLVHNCHTGFWESECKQDLNKENKLQNNDQFYHSPFYFLNQQSIDPVGECCAESQRKPFKHKMLGLLWDQEINLLYSDAFHQP